MCRTPAALTLPGMQALLTFLLLVFALVAARRQPAVAR